MKQPISTAPKDGSFIVLFGGRTSEEIGYEATEEEASRPVIARWEPCNPDDPDDERTWVFAAWDGAWRGFYFNPTHWMHLPHGKD